MHRSGPLLSCVCALCWSPTALAWSTCVFGVLAHPAFAPCFYPFLYALVYLCVAGAHSCWLALPTGPALLCVCSHAGACVHAHSLPCATAGSLYVCTYVAALAWSLTLVLASARALILSPLWLSLHYCLADSFCFCSGLAALVYSLPIPLGSEIGTQWN